MTQCWKCAIGMHEYEIKEELILFTDVNTNNSKIIDTQHIGKTIISRCKHCGKIINTDIITKIKG